MSTYNARRAPNVSQYLQNLNTIPSAQELQAIEFNDSDLDFFTNTEFFDYDQFNAVGDQGFATGTGPVPVPVDGAKGVVGMNGAQFPQFSEFQIYPPTVASTPTSLNGHFGHQSPVGANNLAYATPPQPGDKRKAGTTAADLEEQSRFAAEEDKRRRNTAASARFRVKKKQREQALEKATKEMSDKMSALENKVKQLEMENKWLKGLITEKGDVKRPELEKAEEKETEERSSEGVKRGIGTEVEVEGEEEE